MTELLAAVHPIIIHFPIVLFLLYALFEISGVLFKKEYLIKGAFIILILGVVSAVIAVLTGNQAEELAESLIKVIPSGLEEAIEAHEEWATFTLWYFFIVLAGRTYFTVKKKFTGKLKYIFALLSLIGIFFIFQTGYYGGELVYKHGIGTQLLYDKK